MAMVIVVRMAAGGFIIVGGVMGGLNWGIACFFVL